MRYLFAIFLSTLLLGCRQDRGEWKPVVADANHLHNSMKKLTDVIVHDIFSPPVASRIYAYPSIAAYEILRLSDTTYRSLAGQINELTSIPLPQGKQTDLNLAALDAFMTLGKALIFSEKKVDDFRAEMYKDMDSYRF